MSDYNDTPPTVAGTYWVKMPLGDEEPIHLAPDGSWWYADHPKAMADVDGCQFGQRIPTNAELGELPGLIEEYAHCMTISQEMYDNCDDEKGDEYRERYITARAKINAILGVAE